MTRPTTPEEMQALRREIFLSAAKKRSLSLPVNWEWASPILHDTLVSRVEHGDAATIFYQPYVTLVKQVGMRLGRKAVHKVHEYGPVDSSNRYEALPDGRKNTSQGMFQLAYHAYAMAILEFIATRDQGLGLFRGGVYEIAAELMFNWVRDDFSVPEMYAGMCLQVTSYDHFPYTHIQAWERVHHAMRALPGVSLSRPSRVSLTRSVWDWCRASRPYGREHEVELMSQIDLYGRLEQRVGQTEEAIHELFEIRTLLNRKRQLEDRRSRSVDEVEFSSMAPILGTLGGALPRERMLTTEGTEAVHLTYGRINTGGPWGQSMEEDGIALEYLEPEGGR